LTKSKEFTIKSINKTIQGFKIERKETDSYDQSEYDDSLGSKHSKKTVGANSQENYFKTRSLEMNSNGHKKKHHLG